MSNFDLDEFEEVEITGAENVCKHISLPIKKEQKEQELLYGHNEKQGLHEGISNEEYHSSGGVSSSMLKHCQKSMLNFHAYLDGRAEFKQTDSMKLGTAVHKLILEPANVSDEIIVAKFSRSEKSQAEKRELEDCNPGSVIITPDQYEDARRMRDSVMKLKGIDSIFKRSIPELSGYYQDYEADGSGTGLMCRYRPDWRADFCITDIKSTVDASKEAFAKKISDLYYHVSAAHYLAGDEILCDTDHRQFIFICVESKAPDFEAAIYRLGSQSLVVGEILRRKYLDQIKECVDSGIWPGINGGLPEEIEVPNYELNKHKDFL